MTSACKQVLERLGQPVGPELSAHARSCEDCQAVIESYERLGSLPTAKIAVPLPAGLRAAVAAELAAHPSRATWRKPAALLVALNFLIALGGMMALAHGRLALLRPLGPFGLCLGVLLVGLLIAGPWIALTPRDRKARWGLLVSCTALAAGLLAQGSGIQDEGNFVRLGIPCVLTEIAVSSVPLAIGLWMLTDNAFHPGRAALLALSGGAVGLFALHTHCERFFAPHILVFHLLPWVAMVAVLIWARSRLSSRSFAP